MDNICQGSASNIAGNFLDADQPLAASDVTVWFGQVQVSV